MIMYNIVSSVEEGRPSMSDVASGLPPVFARAVGYCLLVMTYGRSTVLLSKIIFKDCRLIPANLPTCGQPEHGPPAWKMQTRAVNGHYSELGDVVGCGRYDIVRL